MRSNIKLSDYQGYTWSAETKAMLQSLFKSIEKPQLVLLSAQLNAGRYNLNGISTDTPEVFFSKKKIPEDVEFARMQLGEFFGFETPVHQIRSQTIERTIQTKFTINSSDRSPDF